MPKPQRHAEPPPTSLEIAATLAAIDSLHGTVTMARALVLAGRQVDLDGLDREAARLCAAVACMPGNSGEALLPPLLRLAGEVEALSLSLPRP
jgi:hypothetical protein